MAELEAGRYENKGSRIPLISICHGLGRVLVKRPLAVSASRVSKEVEHLYLIFVSTYGTLLYRTPHDGSPFPGMHWGTPGSETQASTQSTTAKHSKTLQNISDQFVKAVSCASLLGGKQHRHTNLEGPISSRVLAAAILNDIECWVSEPFT